jgi:hypothetical protein
MENVMVFDDKQKRRIGLICSIPAIAFFIAFIYYSVIMWPLTQGHHVIYSGEGIISSHYNTLFLFLASAAVITAPVFIYCLVILARLKNLNPPNKMKWIVLLSIMAPVASFLFWFFLIKNEPKYVPIYPSIA